MEFSMTYRNIENSCWVKLKYIYIYVIIVKLYIVLNTQYLQFFSFGYVPTCWCIASRDWRVRGGESPFLFRKGGGEAL